MTRFPLTNTDEFVRITAEPGLILLDFWQASCAPCRALEPRLERLAAARPGMFRGYRVDVDAQPELVARYDVMSIPTIAVLRDGSEITRLDGLIRDSDLEQALHEAPPTQRGGSTAVPRSAANHAE